MKTHLVMLCCYVLSLSPKIYAQTEMTTANDLKEGSLYTFGYKTPKGEYGGFYFDKYFKGDPLLPIFREKNLQQQYTNTIEEALCFSSAFRYVTIAGKCMLFSTEYQKLLATNNSTNFKLVDVAHYNEVEDCQLFNKKIEYRSKKCNGWSFYGRDVLLTASIYDLTKPKETKRRTGSTAPKLFCLDHMANYQYSFTETNQHAAFVKRNVTVALHRSFKDNCYSSLMVPFDIPRYRFVFGFSVQAYELKVDGNKIRFVSMPDSATLKAHTPYILRGRFFAPPYVIPQLNVNYDGTATKTVTVNGVTFTGVYHPQTLQQDDAYILSANQLYRTKAEQSVHLQGFRWYMTLPVAEGKFSLMIDDKDIALGIQEKHIRTIASLKRGVYTLEGIKVAEKIDDKPLRKGAYIVNGRIVIL